MAKVSLDGLRIEVAHASTPDEVTQRLEAFARDLADNKFSDWAPVVTREGEALKLKGRKNGTHFDANVDSKDDLAVVSLSGSIELGRIKLTLAGGSDGVRRRVHDELQATLRRHLGQTH